MNVKAGDLAVIIGSSKYAGAIVEVLYLAPVGVEFQLPDGYFHIPVSPCSWVVKFQRLVPAFGDLDQYVRHALYGVGSDHKLRPVSGLPIEEDTNIEERAPA
jgi:hypothetical protein